MYYESCLQNLGSQFVTSVRRTVDLIQSHPEAGSVIGEKLRRIVVRGFPYTVVYHAEKAGIIVLALAHHKRRPGYWKSRSE